MYNHFIAQPQEDLHSLELLQKRIKLDPYIEPTLAHIPSAFPSYTPVRPNYFLAQSLLYKQMLEYQHMKTVYQQNMLNQYLQRREQVRSLLMQAKCSGPSSQEPVQEKSEDLTEIKEESTSVSPKTELKVTTKVVRVSACKNYIGLLCAGFSRTMLHAKRPSAILDHAEKLIDERRTRYQHLKDQAADKIIDDVCKYIYKTICGKKVKKSKCERDFKIRNSEELNQLFEVRVKDSEQVRFMKEMLRELINYFFDSEFYFNWLSKGWMHENNRIFFIKNKEEIKKKFQNPATYKPKFNHSQNGHISISDLN